MMRAMIDSSKPRRMPILMISLLLIYMRNPLYLMQPRIWGLLNKANPMQRNWSQGVRGVKLAPNGAIHDCSNC
jgi:hypothetical protein